MNIEAGKIVVPLDADDDRSTIEQAESFLEEISLDSKIKKNIS